MANFSPMTGGTARFLSKPGDFEKIAAGLKGLPSAVANKVLSKALRSGGNIIAKEMKAIAPVGTKDKKGKYPHRAGDLKRSIRVRVGKTRGKGERKVIVLVGANSGNWFNIYYPWWVEFGHKATKATPGQKRLQSLRKPKNLAAAIDATKRGIRSAKKPRSLRRARERLRFLLGVRAGFVTDRRTDVRPRPFFRPAFDNKKGEAQATIAMTLRAAIDDEWRKAGK